MVTPVPVAQVRLQDGDEVRIGARTWRVVTGSGHSPEHACLVDDAGKLMISGDQVLPRITSNVSLTLSEPRPIRSASGSPRSPSSGSCRMTCSSCRSHGEPFTGLHARLDALAAGHADRLDALHAHLGEPRRAVDCFSILFGRRIDDGVYGMATGEAMAHLRHLEVEGRAVREVLDGVNWYRAAA